MGDGPTGLLTDGRNNVLQPILEIRSHHSR